MMQKLLYVIMVSVLFGWACQKDDEIIVPNNVAPPDMTISNSTVQNYINRSYISLLGREPDSIEFSAAWSLLRTNNLSTSDRETFIELIISKNEYKRNLYDRSRADLLNNLDTLQINQQIFLFGMLLQNPAFMQFWDLLQYEIDRLVLLRAVPANLQANTLDVKGMHRICSDNYFYDQINMGSLNYVVSVFQHFLFRYPTMAELNSGISMVDGTSTILFLQVGNSKADFADIFFNSRDYYEGQVRDLYHRYLFREPTSTEMTNHAVKYQNSGNYGQLQKDLLTTNEYIGIN